MYKIIEHFSIMFNNNKFDYLYLEQCIIENNTDALKDFFSNKEEGHDVIEKFIVQDDENIHDILYVMPVNFAMEKFFAYNYDNYSKFMFLIHSIRYKTNLDYLQNVFFQKLGTSRDINYNFIIEKNILRNYIKYTRKLIHYIEKTRNAYLKFGFDHIDGVKQIVCDYIHPFDFLKNMKALLNILIKIKKAHIKLSANYDDRTWENQLGQMDTDEFNESLIKRYRLKKQIKVNIDDLPEYVPFEKSFIYFLKKICTD